MQPIAQRRYDCINARLAELVKVKTEPVSEITFKECNYEKPYDFPKDTERFDGIWKAKKDSHIWFHFQINTPKASENQEVLLSVNTGLDGWDVSNPQFILYCNGEIKQGMDIHHTTACLEGGKKYDVWLYGYTGDVDKAIQLDVSIIVTDKRIHRLQRYISACGWMLACTEDKTKEFSELSKILENTVNMLDLRVPYSDEFFASVEKAYAYCKESVKTDEKRPTVWCVGSTHIDFAWLWTKAQTREKVLRSCSTAVELMEQNSQYKFHLSQPAEYKYVKEQSPVLYEKIKHYVENGQWNVEGGMYVEADCNLSGGESIVRQFIVGKKFFKEEFEKDNKVCWLPDVFGYSAAMPQIMKKCGIDLFITSKISWNEYNRMPHEIFKWKGIDGTELLTYFITTQEKKKGSDDYDYCTYVGHATPSEVEGTYYRLTDKDLSDSVLMPYGWGDGGGGTTQEMIDFVSIMTDGIGHSCKTKFSNISEFREELFKQTQGKKLPKWVGELYLEFHRGTYTSMATVKKNNRRAEFAFLNSEWLSVMANELRGVEYPKNQLDSLLNIVLENQFHDILPGSSIEQVYKDTDVEYAKAFKGYGEICSNAVSAIASAVHGAGYLVFNPNAFKASGIVSINDESVYVENIPAKGYKLVNDGSKGKEISVTTECMENDFFRILLDDNAFIVGLWDKRENREVVLDGGKLNAITAYEDMPYEFDNWELKSYYDQKSWLVDNVVSKEIICDGARKGLKVTRKFLSSTFVQIIWLYSQIDRIDFETEVDWKESHIMLKANFDVNVNTSSATFDIQYGAVQRPTHKNTLWDEARFEVCAHKYIDMSEYGYGVSLLNDCKYGHNVEGNRMGLTLLKSGTYPNPNADKCVHRFTYSLYPHKGDYRQAQTIEYAYMLNNPLFVRRIDNENGTLPETFSFVNCDEKNIFTEVVKQSDDGKGIVVRLYENANATTTAHIHFGLPILRASVCDMLENEEQSLENLKGNEITVQFLPYEIKTLYVEVKR